MKPASPEGASKSGEQVLNVTILAQYAQRKPGLLERLVGAYFEEAPTFHQEIKRGAESGDFDLVKLNAHALKSCSINLGAARLSKLCQILETAAVNKNNDDMGIFINQLSPECFEVEEALKSAVFKLTGKPLAGVHTPNGDGHVNA